MRQFKTWPDYCFGDYANCPVKITERDNDYLIEVRDTKGAYLSIGRYSWIDDEFEGTIGQWEHLAYPYQQQDGVKYRAEAKTLKVIFPKGLLSQGTTISWITSLGGRRRPYAEIFVLLNKNGLVLS